MIEVCTVRYLYHTGVERICQVDFSNHPLFPNVIDNVNHNQLQNNVNVTYKEKKLRASHVRSIASRIADKLHEPQNINFFYKVAWRLPEAVIWANLEASAGKTSPGAYFVTLCKMEMDD